MTIVTAVVVGVIAVEKKLLEMGAKAMEIASNIDEI
jgi:hypothetical protein